MQQSLDQLVQLHFKQGDEGVFTAVFNHLYRKLCFFAQRLTGDQREGEDIATDSFVKLWNRRHEFETLGHIKNFLFRITKNACINYLRTGKRKKRYIGYVTKVSPAEEENILRAMIESEIFKELREEVEKISGMAGKVFRKLYYENKTPQEVADELEISVSTVGVHRHNALLILKTGTLKKKLLLWLFLFLSLLR